MKEGSCDSVVYCSVAECGAELSREAIVLPIVDCSFTKYVFNNDADWGVDGTETAACDFGCGETHTRTAVGTMLIADFSVVDGIIEDIDRLLGEEELDEEEAEKLEEIKKELEELRNDPTTSQDEVDQYIGALESIKEAASVIAAERDGYGLFYWLWRFIKAVVEFFLSLKW